jgi:DNA-binding transcriptional LysR family regulator
VWRLFTGREAGRGGDAVRVRGNLTTNDGEIAVNWALDGHGILMRAEWDIERYLQSGRLVQVLPSYKTPDADIYAVYPQRHQLRRGSVLLWSFYPTVLSDLSNLGRVFALLKH